MVCIYYNMHTPPNSAGSRRRSRSIEDYVVEAAVEDGITTPIFSALVACNPPPPSAPGDIMGCQLDDRRSDQQCT